MSLLNAAAENGRRVDVQVLASALGKVRSELVKGYEFKPVFANISPPGEIKGGAIAGMNPAVIADPVERAQYENAIRKNNENGISNARQAMLSELDQEFASLVMGRVKKAFHGGELSTNAAQKCVKAVMLSEDEKKDVMSECHIKKEPRMDANKHK